jgi:hypothetical protein
MTSYKPEVAGQGPSDGFEKQKQNLPSCLDGTWNAPKQDDVHHIHSCRKEVS